MFGTAFLVAPVVSEGVEWDVYLPENQSG
ncbi:hypothetical protein [Flavobacterium piscis]